MATFAAGFCRICLSRIFKKATHLQHDFSQQFSGAVPEILPESCQNPVDLLGHILLHVFPAEILPAKNPAQNPANEKSCPESCQRKILPESCQRKILPESCQRESCESYLDCVRFENSTVLRLPACSVHPRVLVGFTLVPFVRFVFIPLTTDSAQVLVCSPSCSYAHPLQHAINDISTKVGDVLGVQVVGWFWRGCFKDIYKRLNQKSESRSGHRKSC